MDGLLNEFRARFEQGDKAALFSAIRFCGNQERVLPEWVVAAFFHATNRWYSLQCKSLDDAFGLTWPKGAQLKAARKKRELEFAVWNDVQHRRKPGAPANRELFREVGKLHGIGKTLVQEYYRSAAAKLSFTPAALHALGKPFMTPDAKRARATRKITKLRGTRSKPR